jgi:hypothetical protein
LPFGLPLLGHTAIPRESEIDFLTEAEAAFAPPEPKKTATKKAKATTPIKAAEKTAAKKTTTKNQVATRSGSQPNGSRSFPKSRRLKAGISRNEISPNNTVWSCNVSLDRYNSSESLIKKEFPGPYAVFSRLAQI